MVYGQTKYDGENHVREIHSKYYVIRAGWMVGGGVKKDHKFVQKILDQIISGRETIYAVDDKWGTPTYTHDFARNLFKLLDSRCYGTYHMVCEGWGSRFSVAQEILNICNRTDIKLVPVNSAFFEEDYFVPRPRSEMMINANLCRQNLNVMRPWKTALRDYIYREFPHAVTDRAQTIAARVGKSPASPTSRLSMWKGVERRSAKNRRMNLKMRKTNERRKEGDRRASAVG